MVNCEGGILASPDSACKERYNIKRKAGPTSAWLIRSVPH